jgi:starch synthase
MGDILKLESEISKGGNLDAPAKILARAASGIFLELYIRMIKQAFKWTLRTAFTLGLVYPLASSHAQLRPTGPRVLLVSPEVYGILNTGGLGHATAGLAGALHADVLMPYYVQMNDPGAADTGKRFVAALDWRNGQSTKTSDFALLRFQGKNHDTYFLKHQARAEELNYFDNRDKSDNPYAPAAIIGESFGAAARASADAILAENYDVVILNDWTEGLIAYFLHEAKLAGRRVPKVLFAIHNLAYQGLFPPDIIAFLGLDPAKFNSEGYEYYNKVSYLKAGIQYADLVYTVSDRYSRETVSSALMGFGFEGLLRQKKSEGKYVGIINGIDNEPWDPRLTKPGLNWTFSPDDLSGKALGKAELQESLGLPVAAGVPVFVLTSRLVDQKGFEYMIDALSHLVETHGAQVIVTGDRGGGGVDYAARLRELEARFPTQVRYRAFSAELEAKATRYGDFFVNGAWFEPSGLNQFYALINGTIPVVSNVGGLSDSVISGVNGILFNIIHGQNSYDKAATTHSMIRALNEAIAVYRDPVARAKMQRNGMLENNSWDSRVKTYFNPLFERLLHPEVAEPNPAVPSVCGKRLLKVL